MGLNRMVLGWGYFPLELENSIVRYNVYLKDDMGYTYNSSDNDRNSYHVIKDENGRSPAISLRL